MKCKYCKCCNKFFIDGKQVNIGDILFYEGKECVVKGYRQFLDTPETFHVLTHLNGYIRADRMNWEKPLCCCCCNCK